MYILWKARKAQQLKACPLVSKSSGPTAINQHFQPNWDHPTHGFAACNPNAPFSSGPDVSRARVLAPGSRQRRYQELPKRDSLDCCSWARSGLRPLGCEICSPASLLIKPLLCCFLPPAQSLTFSGLMESPLVGQKFKTKYIKCTKEWLPFQRTTGAWKTESCRFEKAPCPLP